ncbi:MAG: SBBP repeat-containing protein [Candidatus Kapabacteria bacterium]|nr:SBBP repeat-containing protein [Ignavibacteriota bacterium]MCW5883751.1 SBBP repeat-containing protein [Candidatus Kapabacteria bacterium]
MVKYLFTNKFTKSLTLAVLFVFFGFLSSNDLSAQDLSWAKSAGGSSTDVGNEVGIDPDGNVIIAGTATNNTIVPPVFGEGEANETTINRQGRNIYIAKYNSNGSFINLSTVYASGTLVDVRDMHIDDSGNIYITGVFNNTLIFDEGELNETTLTSAGSNDIYLAKFANNGDFIWAKSAGGTGSDAGTGIAVDDNGNVYVHGGITASADFDGTILTSNGGLDIFLAKYNSSGVLLDAKSWGGNSNDIAFKLEIKNNSLFAVGYHLSNSIDFDSFLLTKSTGANAYIVKFDTDLSPVWGKSFGSSSMNQARAVDFDGSGNIYVTGLFQGNTTWGGFSLETLGTSDEIVVAKLDSNGDIVWIKSAGGNGGELGQDISVDNFCNVYITGNFSESVTFESGESNEVTFTSEGLSDIYLAKYDNSGNLVWVKANGSTDNDGGAGVAVDNSGNIYNTGRFSNTITFGTGETNETTFTSNGAFDIYVNKYETPWVENVCPRNFAYWKHNEDEFPSSVIPMTLGNNSYSASQLTGLLNAPVKGDASILLARQLISAKLNIANGAAVPSGLLDLISDADNAIGNGYLPMNVRMNSSLGKSMQNLAIELTKFNNGALTAGCESEDNSIRLIDEFSSYEEHKIEGVTSVDDFEAAGFNLSQNYPNPAENVTAIDFYLPEVSNVKIEIYSILGEKIMTILDDSNLGIGNYMINLPTNTLESGSYIYRMTTNNLSKIKVMQVIK